MTAPTQIPEQDVDAIVEQFDSEARFRKLTGIPALVVSAVAIGLSFFHLYTAGTGPLEAMRQRSLHLTLVMVLAFILYPGTRRSDRERPTILDWLLAATTVATVGYFVYNFQAFIMRNGRVLEWEYWIGAIAIVLVLEAGRRVLGKELLIMAAIFLGYAYAGRWIPGIFGHRGYSVNRIIEHMFFGTEGLFGIAIGVSSTYMFLFILMGALLAKTGLSKLINDGAMAIAGTTPGGPAKVSVIASGFMGTMNGSAVANAASTGAFTIPTMKRAGYKAEFAAAVEGASSTGGQIMPPVMGAAAFVMAEFLSVPYGQIIIAATIPALLYYVSIWVMVHLEARKTGLKGLTRAELPKFGAVFREKGQMLIPVVLMVWLLIDGYTPLFAGYWAILSTFAVAWIWEEGRALIGGATLLSRWYLPLPFILFFGLWQVAGMDYSAAGFWAIAVSFVISLINPQATESLAALRNSLREGARSAVGVALATALVGFVVGAASLTSLGLNLGNYIVKFAGDNLLLALFLTMVTSIIVGTGIPTTPTYIIVALVSARALTEMGVPPMAAHLFVFYYGALADVTPPTALSSYAAAGIAGADPQKTTWIAWKLAMAGFIIPYYFAMNPVLLLNVVPATVLETVLAVSTALLGTICLSFGLQGWIWRAAGWIERGALFAAAFLLIHSGLMTDLVGVGLALAVLAYQKFARPTAGIAI